MNTSSATRAADLCIEPQGWCGLLTPLSAVGRDWLNANTTDESTWYGANDSLVVERDYIGALLFAAQSDGLVLVGPNGEACKVVPAGD